MNSIGRAVAVATLAFGTIAAAQDKVEIMSEVVLAATTGDAVEPASLAAMKVKLGKFKYTSLKRLSQEKLVIGAAATQLVLPNNKKATLRLQEIKAGVAKLSVSVPPFKEVTYTLGREGSLYVAAGDHSGGDLWLVLSAAGAK